jgi:hypothetical protein
MSKYPVYIVSKGRWENPLTAKMFLKDGVNFKILVEPQEYEQYCKAIGSAYVKKLPFSNLGLGSYPARNEAWKLSSIRGFKRHWVFDDNIARARRLVKGKKVPINSAKAIELAEEFTDRYENIGITAFNYQYMVVPGSSDKKPFYLNVHAYSCMLIKNDVPFRWRMKYNEDVDLSIQFLHNNWCTVLLNALVMDKMSTVSKMKGGNQTDLYKNNAHEMKLLKSRSLEEVWPQYVKTVMRFNRPHHFVDWKKHFKQPLKRRSDIDWEKLADTKVELKLKKRA